MIIIVRIRVTDEYGAGLLGVPVELATYDGSYLDVGKVTDSNGDLSFELPYDEEEVVRATIYVNGESRGTFELENELAIQFQ
ncbi:hypothetical protein L861_13980 [Litchfieldella anticariensis FP35 = DSM 16096]|uniref:Big-1 domain-containing protein n=1 Tax=Litchfieldella anticariensis (strain DSM 16096 / CECT 5854 / CIP 108499 / LMG 22089 / FP35) TaxID=1121939 RepID=S2KJ74_LITA3|nr:hypothetical protein [Halomonas anticariensis]EPC00378.1 hypothetical protein L861_13980 [Halomonas anticariensis FP35 = DSM 16096]